jgi:hypothetical protein
VKPYIAELILFKINNLPLLRGVFGETLYCGIDIFQNKQFTIIERCFFVKPYNAKWMYDTAYLEITC